MHKMNIFVLGMNEFNKQKLQQLPDADQYNFLELLSAKESHYATSYDVKRLMKKAEYILSNFDGPIDGILSFWDFPISIMQTILGKRYNTIATSPESVIKLENKYWSRINQYEVIPEVVPKFHAFNPFDPLALAKIDLPFPFWVKPIKSFGAYLGAKIENEQDFKEQMHLFQKKVSTITDPFFEILKYANFEVESTNELCIAEEIISGQQCTLEGYTYNGITKKHGVIDTYLYPGMHSFHHFRYPSQLPEQVIDKMEECAQKLMTQVGFNNSAFNIEFFYEHETEDLKLLEVNPRVAQSHSDSFQKVDGVSNHKIIVDLVLGKEPYLPDNEGEYNCAGKFFIRSQKNGLVIEGATQEKIKLIKEKYPDVFIETWAQIGDELAELAYQDSASYKLAIVYLGGQTDEQMQEKFEDIKNILDYRIENIDLARLL